MAEDVNQNFLDRNWWKTATIEDIKAEIAKGADIRAINNEGKTVFDYAVERNDVEIIDFLRNIFLNMPMDYLELSVRTANCLKNINIHYVKELLNKSPEEYLKIPNFGRKSLNEITNALSTYGIYLRTPHSVSSDYENYATNDVPQKLIFLYTNNIEEKIDNLLESLSPQEKDCVVKYYGLNCDKHTFSDIARQYKVSTTYIGHIIHKVIRKFKHPSRKNQLKQYYHADNLFKIYGNILHKRYSYFNLLENILNELPGDYYILREKNEIDRSPSSFYINKRETLYINKSVNLDLSTFISDFHKSYSEEELHILIESKLKNILNSEYKIHYDMVAKALEKIIKEKYFRCTQDGYKVDAKHIQQINKDTDKKANNMEKLNSTAKKLLTIEIDENLYNTFINKLGQMSTNEVVEQLISEYVAAQVSKEKKHNLCENNNQDKPFYAKAYNKIPNWAKKPNQFNSTIVWAYFRAEDLDGQATLSRMRGLCLDKMSEQQFKSNYFQMTFDGSNSHGKVFEDDGENVWIWEEIKPRLMQYKNAFYKGE